MYYDVVNITPYHCTMMFKYVHKQSPLVDEELQQFFKDLNLLRDAIGPLEKDSTGKAKSFKWQYLSLKKLVESSYEPLLEYQFQLEWSTDVIADHNVINIQLIHLPTLIAKCGQLRLNDEQETEFQDTGKRMTYLIRYVTKYLLGLIEEDESNDDYKSAKSSQGTGKRRRSSLPPPPKDDDEYEEDDDDGDDEYEEEETPRRRRLPVSSGKSRTRRRR